MGEADGEGGAGENLTHALQRPLPLQLLLPLLLQLQLLLPLPLPLPLQLPLQLQLLLRLLYQLLLIFMAHYLSKPNDSIAEVCTYHSAGSFCASFHFLSPNGPVS